MYLLLEKKMNDMLLEKKKFPFSMNVLDSLITSHALKTSFLCVKASCLSLKVWWLEALESSCV